MLLEVSITLCKSPAASTGATKATTNNYTTTTIVLSLRLVQLLLLL